MDPGFGDAGRSFEEVSLEMADLVDAATERRLLESPSLSLLLPSVEALTSVPKSVGVLLGGTANDSKEGVDEFPEAGERSSGVEMEGLGARLGTISGVDMGVGF